MNKSKRGYFFEDYYLGQVIDHAVSRTLTDGDKAIYQSLYPGRYPIYSSEEFAKNCGLLRSPLDNLIVFNTIFGKSVPDISLNAVANLGYAECRFFKPVYPGQSLSARSEIIGLKENSSGESGIVWVRTFGMNELEEIILTFVRWVIVRKRLIVGIRVETFIPKLVKSIDSKDLIIPDALNYSNYDYTQSGEKFGLFDYKVGERIDHVDRVTISESEHMMATRLWQNTAKVHFDITSRKDGRRLVYGGHIISMGRALSFNGLANAQIILGINSGVHSNPCFASDTIEAWSEVLELTELKNKQFGAVRLRLVVQKAEATRLSLFDVSGGYDKNVLLDMDYWALIPI